MAGPTWHPALAGRNVDLLLRLPIQNPMPTMHSGRLSKENDEDDEELEVVEEERVDVEERVSVRSGR